MENKSGRIVFIWLSIHFKKETNNKKTLEIVFVFFLINVFKRTE